MEPAHPTPTPTGTDRSQTLLDEFFDRAVGALQLGKPIPFPEQLQDDPALAAAAERLAAVARALCSCAAPSLNLKGYTVLSELGRGGMGVVYLARQEKLGGRPVAIKVLPPHVAQSLAARERFRSEVLAVAKQRHAGIVSVYDIVEDGETLAYVMEWVDGITLQQILEACQDKGGAADGLRVLRELLGSGFEDASYFSFVARVGSTIARALDAVHRSGILHRDVKPSNILLRRDGSPLLSDFGLAKNSERESVTHGPGFAGTMQYASPEQLRAEKLDARSDIYSLGATLYHLLTLRLPANEPSVPAAIESLRRGDFKQVLRERSDIPPQLSRVVERAISFDRAHRYTTALQMSECLDSLSDGNDWSGISPIQRTPRMWLGGIAAVVLLVGVTAIVLRFRSRIPGHDPGPWATPARLALPNPHPGDEFGHSVSGWGMRVLVGAARGDSTGSDSSGWDGGRAAIFACRGDSWDLEAELTGPGLSRGSELGECVLLGEDFALVGAPGAEMEGVPRAGAMYVFRLQGGAWVFQHRVGAPVPFEGGGFGFRARRSGDIVVITSSSGSIHARGDTSNAPAEPTGPAHVFRLGPAGLTHLQSLCPQNLRSAGLSCTIPDVVDGGEFIVLGAPLASTSAGDQSGAVYAYTREPGMDRWTLSSELIVPSTKPFDNLGTQVVSFRIPDAGQGIDSVRLAVSAATWSYPENKRVGRVFVFRPQRDDAGRLDWVVEADISPTERTPEALFGLTLRALDARLAIFHKVPGLDGELYCRVGIFERNVDRSWRLVHDVAHSPQVEDDLGLGMDLWRPQGNRGPWIFAAGAAKLDWPNIGEGPWRDRGVLWAWRLGESD